MRYGSCVFRHGRSRLFSSYHLRRRLRNLSTNSFVNLYSKARSPIRSRSPAKAGRCTHTWKRHTLTRCSCHKTIETTFSVRSIVPVKGRPVRIDMTSLPFVKQEQKPAVQTPSVQDLRGTVCQSVSHVHHHHPSCGHVRTFQHDDSILTCLHLHP